MRFIRFSFHSLSTLPSASVDIVSISRALPDSADSGGGVMLTGSFMSLLVSSAVLATIYHAMH